MTADVRYIFFTVVVNVEGKNKEWALKTKLPIPSKIHFP